MWTIGVVWETRASENYSLDRHLFKLFGIECIVAGMSKSREEHKKTSHKNNLSLTIKYDIPPSPLPLLTTKDGWTIFSSGYSNFKSYILIKFETAGKIGAEEKKTVQIFNIFLA